MQTQISKEILDTPEGQMADRILRSCVHCGFCTATCPTYQLLGDELDGPRGRIYLIKQVLEGNEATDRTRDHLDRCLTCRSCETTCPSGVEYGKLLDYGRYLVEQRTDRPVMERMTRAALLQVLPYPNRFGPLLKIGQLMRPLLPEKLRKKTPAPQAAGPRPAARHERTMIALEGCAQSSATPKTNAAAARVLDRLGISLISAPDAGCCGAANYHLSDHDTARHMIRRNIDAWWPLVESGAEAIVMTASGCGVKVKQYGHVMAGDPEYAAKATKISELTRDLGEILSREDIQPLATSEPTRVAFHAPCTLQHGQKLPGLIESLLTQLGYELTPVKNPHLCCGSAGTYSILQSEISGELLTNKLESLQSSDADVIATANVGCQLHLATEATIPVIHWIELLDR